MTRDTYNQALQTAKIELIHAIEQRQYWSLEIARLDQLAKALSAEVEKKSGKTASLADLKGLDTGVGLTDVVLSTVNRSAKALSPKDVKDSLLFYGYDISRYANPMAMIHQTLKRLAEQRNIRDMEDGTYRRTALYEALINLK